MCLRGCYGAQYEYGEEIFMPVPGVCKMLKTKYDFLIRKYDELGVIEYFRSIKPSDVYYELVQKMLKACDRVRKTWRAK
jgi:hypothetical protein